MPILLVLIALCIPLELISAAPALPDWTAPELCATPWQRDGATIEWQHRASIRSFWLDAGGYTLSAASYTPRTWELRQLWPQTGQLLLTEYSEGKIEGHAVYRVQWHQQYIPLVIR